MASLLATPWPPSDDAYALSSLPSEDIEVGITKKPSLSRNKISTSWRRQVTMTCKMTRGLMMYDDDV